MSTMLIMNKGAETKLSERPERTLELDYWKKPYSSLHFNNRIQNNE